MKIWSIPIIWSLLIAIMSLMPGNKLPSVDMEFENLDKVVHFLMYFILAGTVYYAFQRSKMPWNYCYLLFAGVILYGVFIELLQENFFQGRFFDILDIIANIIGSIGGMFLAFLIFKNE